MDISTTKFKDHCATDGKDGEEFGEETEIIGFKPSSCNTLGLLGFACCCKRTYLRTTHVTCPLEDATCILIKDKNGATFVKKIKTEKTAEPQGQRSANLKYFTNNEIRYFWNDKEKNFKKQSSTEIEAPYKYIEGFDTLEDIHVEIHCQFDVTREKVTETVEKCRQNIREGKLLHAHKCLISLEKSRDDLLFELNKQQRQSKADSQEQNLLGFCEADELSDELGNRLWLVLRSVMVTAFQQPSTVVACLRIIEREEKIDDYCMKTYDQQQFMPSGRPKRWHEKGFEILAEVASARIKEVQREDRTTEKMWLARHLERIRQLALRDLLVFKKLCRSCSQISDVMVKQLLGVYHAAISQHLLGIIREGLEGNESVSLLIWISEYTQEEFLGNNELNIPDTLSDLPPLLDSSVVATFQNEFIEKKKKEFNEWMLKALEIEMKDWYRSKEPDAGHSGFYHTSFPMDVFDMIKENLQVAKAIDEELLKNVVSMWTEELARCLVIYKGKLTKYKEQRKRKSNQPQYYLQYMIGNINNCLTFVDMIVELGKKYNLSESTYFLQVAKSYDELAQSLCGTVLNQVFVDLEPRVQELFTKKWVTSSVATVTICATIEDYCQHFVHLKDRYFTFLLNNMKNRLACQYLTALLSRKVTFKSYDDRAPAAEKICKEAEQLTSLFTRLLHESLEDSPFDALTALAELIKLQDTSVIPLEISAFARNFPDVKKDHLVNILAMREDMTRPQAKAKVTETLGKGHGAKSPTTTIFSKL